MSRGRRYCKVSPRLHTGRVGRSIRGEDVASLRAQSLAAYLVSCPHGNAIGLFFLPVGYIMADRGWSYDGALHALSTLRERGLIRYDEKTEWLWLIEDFRHEFGEDPAPPKEKKDGTLTKPDSRIPLIHRLLDEAAESGFLKAFLDHHRPSYPQLLGTYDTPTDAPLHAPSTDRVPQEQEQEQEQENPPNSPPRGKPSRKKSGKLKPKNVPRDIKPSEIDTWIRIPDGLLGVPWFTKRKLAERISLAKQTKSPGLWERELRVLANARATHGDAVAELVFEVATDKGWRGITALYVQGIARDVAEGRTPRSGEDLRSRDERRLAQQNQAIMSHPPPSPIDVRARLDDLAERLPDWAADYRERVRNAGSDVVRVEETLRALEKELLGEVSLEAASEAEAEVDRRVMKAHASARMSKAAVEEAAAVWRAEARRKAAGLPELSLFAPLEEEGEDE